MPFARLCSRRELGTVPLGRTPHWNGAIGLLRTEAHAPAKPLLDEARLPRASRGPRAAAGTVNRGTAMCSGCTAAPHIPRLLSGNKVPFETQPAALLGHASPPALLLLQVLQPQAGKYQSRCKQTRTPRLCQRNKRLHSKEVLLHAWCWGAGTSAHAAATDTAAPAPGAMPRDGGGGQGACSRFGAGWLRGRCQPQRLLQGHSKSQLS